MSNVWILDVIADLKTFAESNGLLRLADQLEATAGLAEEEIAGSRGRPVKELLHDAGASGRIYRAVADR